LAHTTSTPSCICLHSGTSCALPPAARRRASSPAAATVPKWGERQELHEVQAAAQRHAAAPCPHAPTDHAVLFHPAALSHLGRYPLAFLPRSARSCGPRVPWLTRRAGRSRWPIALHRGALRGDESPRGSVALKDGAQALAPYSVIAGLMHRLTCSRKSARPLRTEIRGSGSARLFCPRERAEHTATLAPRLADDLPDVPFAPLAAPLPGEERELVRLVVGRVPLGPIDPRLFVGVVPDDAADRGTAVLAPGPGGEGKSLKWCVQRRWLCGTVSGAPR
jgi:hypothetical protein